MVCTPVDHRNNIKKGQNAKGTKSHGQVVSLQSLEDFYAISMVDKSIDDGKLFWTVLTITLTVFDVHFHWSF